MAKKEKRMGGRELAPVRPGEVAPFWEREFDRILDDFRRMMHPTLWRTEPWWPRPSFRLQAPAVDVLDEKDDIVVKAEMPGLSKDDIEVVLTGSTLTIKGQKKKEEEAKEENYYRCERSYGAFARSIDLPAEVRGGEVKATFKDGVLSIRLPKTEAAKQKQIKLKVE